MFVRQPASLLFFRGWSFFCNWLRRSLFNRLGVYFDDLIFHLLSGRVALVNRAARDEKRIAFDNRDALAAFDFCRTPFARSIFQLARLD